MKKIKLLLGLTLMLTTLAPLNAQDASNDATWEETIGFIKKKSNYFMHTYDIHSGTSTLETSNFEIKGEKILLISQIYNNKDYYKYKLNLQGLLWVSTYPDDNLLHLVFISKKYIQKLNENDDDLDDLTVGNFQIEDIELYPRLIKAFKHLAYLATKKREDERKSSGEKF